MIVRDVMRTASIFNLDAYFSTMQKRGSVANAFGLTGTCEKCCFSTLNARPHTGVRTREAVTQLGWTVLPQLPRRADLEPSGFDLLGPLNDAVHGSKFESDDNVVNAARILVASRGQGMVPVGRI